MQGHSPSVSRRVCVWARSKAHVQQLLGFKGALEVLHLLDTDGHKGESLQNEPPQPFLLGAFFGLLEVV